jgi:hypothetical protein
VQSLQALALPSMPQDDPDFKVSDWVCVARMGNYWGEIGCIVGIEGSCIMLLLPPHLCGEAKDLVVYRHWGIRVPDNEFWMKPAGVKIHTQFGLECWEHQHGGLLAEKNKVTMVLKPFKPWELSRRLPDGSEPAILPSMANTFCKFLDSSMCERIPPSLRWLHPLLEPAGELVLLGSNVGVIIELGEVSAAIQFIKVYLMGMGFLQSPADSLVKFHRPGAQVYSLQDEELGRAVSCDYLLQQIEVKLRSGKKVSATPNICLYSV